MRRTVSWITAAAIMLIAVLASLSGCSSPQTDKQPSVTGADDSVAKVGKTVITCTYNNADGVSAPPDKEVNEYLKSLGCDFSVDFVPIDYIGNGLKRLIDEGTPPDIVYTVCLEFEDMETTVYTKLYYDDIYLRLDDFLFDTEVGKKLYEAFPEKHWNELKAGGGIYAVDGSLSTLTTNFGYIYDKALVEKYSYDISLSPLEQLDKLSKIANDRNTPPFLLGNDFFSVAGYTDSRRLAKGVVFDEKSCQAISVLEDEEFLSSIEVAYTLAQQGLADSESRSDYFAMRFFSPVNMQNGAPFEYQGRTVLPQMKNSPKLQGPVNVIGIYRDSANPDKAFEFLSLCMTDPYLNNLLTYGVEGDGCKIDSDGYVTKRWDGEGSTVSQFVNRYIAHPNFVERFMDISREQYADTMEAAEQRPYAAGFVVNVDSVYAESQAVELVLKKMSGEIVAPEKDVDFNDFVDKYRKKLSEAGLQAIIDEVNRQYAAFAESDTDS